MAEQNKKANILQIILVVALIVAAYFIGNLTAKVQYLQKGAAPAAAGTAQAPSGVPSKYKSFEEAMGAMAKLAKLDDKKLVACMTSGEKASVVNADASEGNSVGVNGTPAFFINGKFIGGAFPYAAFKEVIDKEIAGTGSTNYKDYSDTLQKAYAQGAFNPEPKQISLGNAPTRGTKGAPVTIVEYSDFQCPYCEVVFPTVQQILKEYNGKVLFAYKYLPLISIHPRAQKSAEAAACAKDMGKFWEFHDALFQNQKDWSSL